MSENVLDEDTWKLEAEAVFNDIREHVKSVSISNKFPSNNRRIILNLTTLENDDFCVELSSLGFRVVGQQHDCNDNCSEYYETPYSLLNNISPLYKKSFGNALVDKLSRM